MIFSLSFNPCEMVYTSWMTVSSLTMATLLLLASKEFYELSDNDKKNVGTANKKRPIDYYKLCFFIFINCLIILIIIGILCFIFGKAHEGAICITSVLISLLVVFPISLILRLKANTANLIRLKKIKIDVIASRFQENFPKDI